MDFRYKKIRNIPDDCYNPIKKFSFCSPKNSVTISDNVAKAAVLDVRKTYRFLANRAQTSGANNIHKYKCFRGFKKFGQENV